MTNLDWFSIGVVLCYALVFLCAGFLFFRMKEEAGREEAIATSVTLLIPVRNEAETIGGLLDQLQNQNFPKDLLEILVVNDASTDDTVAVIEAVMKKNNRFVVRLLHTDLPGKKAALTLGVTQARGELIVTTDADVRVQRDWLHAIVRLYERERLKLIVGPVQLIPSGENKFIDTIQLIEHTALQALSGGGLAADVPVMCSGANLAYPKSVFEKVGGYTGDTAASGDDMFLMQRIHHHFPKSIRFLKAKQAIVQTPTAPTLRTCLQQRQRWAAKFSSYRSIPVLSIGMLVFSTQLLLVTGLLLSTYFHFLFIPTLILLLGKTLTDVLFLYLAAPFFGNRFIPVYSAVFQIPYLLLSFAVMLGSVTTKYTWKGRQYRS